MELKITLQEAREMLNVYGKIPDIPKGFTATAFALVRKGEPLCFISCIDLRAVKQYGDEGATEGKRIILTPKPKKYRYVTDGNIATFRKHGDYVAETRPDGSIHIGEYTPGYHYTSGLTFKREEITE